MGYLAYRVLKWVSRRVLAVGWLVERLGTRASWDCQDAIIHRLGRCPECGRRLENRACPVDDCTFNIPW